MSLSTKPENHNPFFADPPRRVGQQVLDRTQELMNQLLAETPELQSVVALYAWKDPESYLPKGQPFTRDQALVSLNDCYQYAVASSAMTNTTVQVLLTEIEHLKSQLKNQQG